MLCSRLHKTRIYNSVNYYKMQNETKKSCLPPWITIPASKISSLIFITYGFFSLYLFFIEAQISNRHTIVLTVVELRINQTAQ